MQTAQIPASLLTHRDLITMSIRVIERDDPPIKSARGGRTMLGRTKLANKLKIKPINILNWHRYNKVPRVWWLHIEKATDGEVPESLWEEAQYGK